MPSPSRPPPIDTASAQSPEVSRPRRSGRLAGRAAHPTPWAHDPDREARRTHLAERSDEQGSAGRLFSFLNPFNTGNPTADQSTNSGTTSPATPIPFDQPGSPASPEYDTPHSRAGSPSLAEPAETRSQPPSTPGSMASETSGSRHNHVRRDRLLSELCHIHPDLWHIFNVELEELEELRGVSNFDLDAWRSVLTEYPTLQERATSRLVQVEASFSDYNHNIVRQPIPSTVQGADRRTEDFYKTVLDRISSNLDETALQTALEEVDTNRPDGANAFMANFWVPHRRMLERTTSADDRKTVQLHMAEYIRTFHNHPVFNDLRARLERDHSTGGDNGPAGGRVPPASGGGGGGPPGRGGGGGGGGGPPEGGGGSDGAPGRGGGGGGPPGGGGGGGGPPGGGGGGGGGPPGGGGGGPPGSGGGGGGGGGPPEGGGGSDGAPGRGGGGGGGGGPPGGGGGGGGPPGGGGDPPGVPSAAARSHPRNGWVYDGDMEKQVVSYRRSGSGHQVLLKTPAPCEGYFDHELVAAHLVGGDAAVDGFKAAMEEQGTEPPLFQEGSIDLLRSASKQDIRIVSRAVIRRYGYPPPGGYLNAPFQYLELLFVSRSEKCWYAKSTVARYHNSVWVDNLLRGLYDASGISPPDFTPSLTRQRNRGEAAGSTAVPPPGFLPNSGTAQTTVPPGFAPPNSQIPEPITNRLNNLESKLRDIEGMLRQLANNRLYPSPPLETSYTTPPETRYTTPQRDPTGDRINSLEARLGELMDLY
ncbi:predicted protein [Histoplasma mississippiense (nom. inval.)]|uniref:predicted protein n=1 Tax=Ajellomyces capsulatus (strain NAm1 / WU24) TaxID=2059318 RepID=UPI000157D4FB|nr:predicted protein [Histoplasma mississippiense (nom. inval.)]EDN05110.1 predicted protein [Histoplasma mississippiense (nom. inval.)]